MRVDVGLRGGVLLADVALQFLGLDTPLAAAANADGGQLAAPYECVRLAVRDVQDLGDVCQREEPRRIRSEWHGHSVPGSSDPTATSHRGLWMTTGVFRDLVQTVRHASRQDRVDHAPFEPTRITSRCQIAPAALVRP